MIEKQLVNSLTSQLVNKKKDYGNIFRQTQEEIANMA